MTESKTTMIEHVRQLQLFGFRVFPLAPNSKLPLVAEFPEVASRDAEKAQIWWKCPLLEIDLNNNIGISTNGLLVVDIDVKEGKKGDESVLAWELEGNFLPTTYTQFTPSGGRHLVYRAKNRIGNSSCRIASGVDIRGEGGFIVGAGSEIDDKSYTTNWFPIAEAPPWLELLCALKIAQEATPVPVVAVDETQAFTRAKSYLATAPTAVEGAGGDHATFLVAAKLKDLGVDALAAHALMMEHWNDRCTPPWDADELFVKVENAYRYGKEKVGVSAPETVFDSVSEVAAAHPDQSGISPDESIAPPHTEPIDPIDELNREFALVIGGLGHHVLRETTDAKGNFTLQRMPVSSFHLGMVEKGVMSFGGKTEAVSRVWLQSPRRRTYMKGYCFRPNKKVPLEFYNLWRGFAVEPLPEGEAGTEEEQWGVNAWLEHLHENVCQGDAELSNWLLGYFAHLVQHPDEKPLTALVFRGKKGVGKNALVDRVGHLLGNHYLLVSNSRYLTSNFNAHLENLLLFVLDEAFWSGDKSAEGTLKDLITGNTHAIERKGEETYKVDNCTRVIILGNEEWIVPASHDERRFAVFNVGEGKQQDNNYFLRMRLSMEAGGYRLLLRHLLRFDLSTVEVNQAPSTQGLLDQKISSLSIIAQWVFDSLQHGHLLDFPFDEQWPFKVTKTDVREAFFRYSKNRAAGKWLPTSVEFGMKLNEVLKGALTQGKINDGVRRTQAYCFKPLEECRKAFETYIGRKVDWKNEDDNDL